MAFLTRIDPAKNVNRFYVIRLDPALFGWTRTREWGRRGTPGRMSVTTFESYVVYLRLDLVERKEQSEGASRRRLPRGEGVRFRPLVIGAKALAQGGIECRGALEPDVAVLLAPGIALAACRT